MEKKRDTVYILLIASMAMAVICAFITYLSTKEKRESVAMVIHTYLVMESAENILSLLKDLESGHRGFLITKDSAFLEPYDDAIDQLETESVQLSKLVKSNLPQSKFLQNRLLPAVEKRKMASLNTLEVLSTYGADSARSLIESKVGKSYMDTIRLLVSHFNQNEQVLLAERETELEENIFIEDIIQLSSFAVIGITCALAFFRLVRERRSINHLMGRLELANISLEKKVQERTQQLLEADRAKDHFLGIASHDLKVPIAGIMGLIEIMRLENSKRDPTDIEYLSYMEESCKGMQNLISNLLDINSIDRGETRFVRERIDIFPFLTKLEKRFTTNARNKGIPLHFEKINAVLESDAATLTRILENLISNALKFSLSGHPVVVKAEAVDRHIRFHITDTGPGIPDHEIPLLFQKFARLTNRPTAGESSSGLGLAIVKELTEQAGGTLDVVSERAKGSTFTITLPAN